MSSGSGAWRLDLPRGANPRKLVARLGSIALERELAAGTENLQLDLHFDVRRAVADLEAKLGKLPDTAVSQQRALRLRLLELRLPATAVEEQLATEVAEFKTAVLAGLGTRSRSEADSAFHAARRSWAGTVVEDWLEQAQDADVLVRAAIAVRAIENGAARAKRARTTATAIEEALAGITSIDLWRALTGLRRELLAM
jgi:hypothetical protein